MDPPLPLAEIAKLVQANAVQPLENIQSLWSGYGQIVRVQLVGLEQQADLTAIVKHVCPPEYRDHKYGWSGDVSHQRKLRSYENETRWYRNVSDQCDENCRVPRLMAAETTKGANGEPSWLLVMEDLDAAGFDLRHRQVTAAQTSACLKWLASFHATFLHDSANDGPRMLAASSTWRTLPASARLWPIGTYWHLATRPDELKVMEDGPLKQSAEKIDAALNNARFQTLVHGDAKLANFCFSSDDQVAAVDFQYVGGGCGMKDVAYFISSCFSDQECEKRESELLAIYFHHLQVAVTRRNEATAFAFDALEEEWRSLYSFAWADFYRFLSGWSPGHWKMHTYSERMADSVIQQLA